jgi:ubiquinone/menaquinone biosynthesis C-methylase UbiE
MFSASAKFYDAIYSAFKDYEAESASIAALVRAEHPGAQTILDIACGTGEHAKHLRYQHGFDVTGLDLDPGLLSIARGKLPEAQFYQADMSAFELDRRFDVVLSLFSSIGYLQSLDRVVAALRCFCHHVTPGGVIVVEPWFAPGVLQEGKGPTKQGETHGVRIERASHTTIAGRTSRLVFDYRIEEGEGVRDVQEVHELGLFTPSEMLESFRAAGLSVAFDATGLTGRGLYVARPIA